MVGACGESRKPKPFSPEVTTSIHKPIPSQSEGAECFYLYQEFLTAKEETHLKHSRDLARWRARSSEVRDKYKLPPLGKEAVQPGRNVSLRWENTYRMVVDGLTKILSPPLALLALMGATQYKPPMWRIGRLASIAARAINCVVLATQCTVAHTYDLLTAHV